MSLYHRCDLGLEEAAVHTFRHCSQMRSFWDHVSDLTARIDSEHLVHIDLAYTCDNVLLSCAEVRRIVILMLLAVERMVVWMMRMEGI